MTEERKINLEEILKEYLTVNTMRVNKPDYTFMMVLSAMKETVRQALDLAVENAKLKVYTEYTFDEPKYYVDKDSIINTINQIE